MTTDTPLYCTNHPKTETLLRCNKCGRPFCTKCLERTPVGYRCKECLTNQRIGYYTATPVDYVLAGIIGFVASIIGGAIASVVGGFFFLFALFYAPIAGGAIAEVIRFAIQRRRGRYIALLAAAMLVLGGIIGAGAFPLFAALFSGNLRFILFALPTLVTRSLFNIGVLIYIALGASTVYARLRS